MKSKPDTIVWTEADQWLCSKQGYWLARTPNRYGVMELQLHRVEDPDGGYPISNDFQAWIACMTDANDQVQIAIKCLTYLKQERSPDWYSIVRFGVAERAAVIQRLTRSNDSQR